MFERILITGGAGFIGSHVIDRLLGERVNVLCLDSFNDYYDPVEKTENISCHLNNPNFVVERIDVGDGDAVLRTVKEWRPDAIIHLAARAGVRPSLTAPRLYVETNVGGTLNVLEAARKCEVEKVVFASSSSVYGINNKVPFEESDSLLSPASPYAATKIAGEAMCHSYAHLYALSITALRFFTVYGPRQRPDLAIRKFTEQIEKGEPIILFGDGSSGRDYTYIDDIVAGIIAAVKRQSSKYEVYNLGNSKPILLKDLVGFLENALGKKAKLEYTTDQPGDVPITYASINKAYDELGYRPITPIEDGLKNFVKWYRFKNRL